jgi:branched-chain amino acid transport system ATP-binding protein
MSLVLQAKDLTVSFGGVLALDGFSLDVEEGEIHGVIGPNGAGKTTAINVLTGFIRNRGGQIQFSGKPLPVSPHLIAQAGIARTFQASAIFPDLSAGENVMCAGHRWTESGLLSCMFRTDLARAEEIKLKKSAQIWLNRVGFKSYFDTPMKSLPFGEQRKVEIARALMAKPKILLLDEPTAGLTIEEVKLISVLLKSINQDGEQPISVLIIEHNVPFIFSLCDRVTAMESGKNIDTGTPAEIRKHKKVISSYLGGEISVNEQRPIISPTLDYQQDLNKIILEARAIEVGYGRIKVIHGINLTVKQGELIIICGRNGAGKSTLLNSLVGHPRISAGEIQWYGSRIDQLSVSQIVRSGIALVPQERGIIAEQSVDANLRLASIGLGLSAKNSLIRQEETLDRFPKLKLLKNQLAGTLSGGERQMLALAKVLIRKPQLLLLDEPSIGLAPTILEGLQKIIADISKQGISVIVAEQNVGWIAPLATRAYLLESGKFVAQGRPDEIIRREQLIESFLGNSSEKTTLS